jgi:hypothetical protein
MYRLTPLLPRTRRMISILKKSLANRTVGAGYMQPALFLCSQCHGGFSVCRMKSCRVADAATYQFVPNTYFFSITCLRITTRTLHRSASHLPFVSKRNLMPVARMLQCGVQGAADRFSLIVASIPYPADLDVKLKHADLGKRSQHLRRYQHDYKML